MSCLTIEQAYAKKTNLKLEVFMQKFHILIAEDDADDRYLFQTAFAEKGIADPIEFVHDGDELLHYLERVYESNGSIEHSLPYFILLDLNMPKKDGKEVLKLIKQHPVYKKIPVAPVVISPRPVQEML